MIPAHVGHRGWQRVRGTVVAGLGLLIRASLRVDHAERLPRHGPGLVVCNHLAYVDTVKLAAVLPPFVLCGPRPRWFATPWRRTLMAVAQAVAVTDRETFLSDCAGLLAQGRLIVHYPELGRNPDGLGDVVPWALDAARAAGVLVWPVAFTTPEHLVAGRATRPKADPSDDRAWLRETFVGLGAPCPKPRLQ